MKKDDASKNLKVYTEDWKEINHMAVDMETTQAEVIRKLLQQYKK